MPCQVERDVATEAVTHEEGAPDGFAIQVGDEIPGVAADREPLGYGTAAVSGKVRRAGLGVGAEGGRERLDLGAASQRAVNQDDHYF